ncbi:MAG: inner membrane CreD family protein, partial [Leptospirales bacterium]|nr:inner membrane CreD family protein [Leptospirales bacterium]
SISSEGFKASWTFRSQDPSMLGPELDQNDFEASVKPDEDVQSFGVDFFVPVDLYAQIERAVKYSMLFIALTFLTFFIFEVVAGLQIHPVQYLFVGLALSLFFLLLLSLAEHIGFGKAYTIAATADIALIAAYTFKILNSKLRSGILFAILTGLYAFLYVILQLEMYSLLAGSIGLFVILALVMYATRNIDWYARDTRTA